MLSHHLPCISVPQAVKASNTIPQQSLAYILTISGNLSHCLSKYKGKVLLENELKQDAIKDREVISVQLISQPLEKCGLLGRKHFAVEVVSIRYLDPTAVAAPYSFNGI